MSLPQKSAPGVSHQAPGTFPFGSLAYLGAALSILMCYTNVIVRLFAPFLGISLPPRTGSPSSVFGINPHVQGVLMWAFGLLAVIGLARDKRYNQSKSPLIIGIAGFLVIVGTLYTYYDRTILLFGYLLLLVAAFVNQNTMLAQLNRTVQKQASDLESLNRNLEQQVTAQVGEIERLARLKRFLSPEVANLITTGGNDHLLDCHRRYICTLFCDIRGFTSFSEAAEPEEVIGLLQSYHERLGRLVAQHNGTLAHRAGDGLMVLFNDPLSCDQPVLQAVKLALEMRNAFGPLKEHWEKRGYQLGFGVGIANGYATVGVVGFEGRYDYTANGNVVNLASRLCGEAADGQILISHKAFVDVENDVEVEQSLEFDLKGLGRAVTAHNVVGFANNGQPHA